YVTGVVSVRRLSPQVAGVVACLEAVIATVLAWVLLGEHLGAPQIAGGAVVLVGAFIAQSSTPKAAPARPVAGGTGEAGAIGAEAGDGAGGGPGDGGGSGPGEGSGSGGAAGREAGLSAGRTAP
ncbi:EamA family transporter, partial [Streptomyces sp. WAC02707]